MPIKKLLAYALSILVSFSMISCGGSKESKVFSTQAFPFELESVAGKTVKLKDYENQVVLLVFWATWCQPCQMEIPSLKDLHAEYKDKPLKVISISVDENAREVLPAFQQEYQLPYPVLYSTPEVIAGYGNVSSLPTSFLIDRSGNIVYQFVGLTPHHMFKKKIEELLNKKPDQAAGSPS